MVVKKKALSRKMTLKKSAKQSRMGTATKKVKRSTASTKAVTKKKPITAKANSHVAKRTGQSQRVMKQLTTRNSKKKIVRMKK